MSSIGLWYKQVIFQGFLSDRLKENRTLNIETESLIPFLLEKTKTLSSAELMVEDRSFIDITAGGEQRWKIGRSALKDGKMEFTFDLFGEGKKVITRVVGNVIEI